MSKPTETRICLLRHGETDWNAEQRIQGSIDIDLNAAGRRQAELAARHLAGAAVAALYSSDLLRAWRTAEAIGRALGLSPRALPRMRERDWGVLQGLTAEEAEQRHPHAFQRMKARDPDYDFETGESKRAVSQRVAEALEGIAAAHAGETIIIVLHGGVLDVINRYVRGTPLDTRRDFDIPNAGLNWLVRDASGWRIESWAETRHLRALALDELPA